jgi:hypothetical protein
MAAQAGTQAFNTWALWDIPDTKRNLATKPGAQKTGSYYDLTKLL